MLTKGLSVNGYIGIGNTRKDENMGYTYILPDENNQIVECETEINAVVIIGANGSGKSRLGAWIEQNNVSKVHRVGAQRSLTFGTYIQQKGYEQSTNLLMYGSENPQTEHDARWKWDGEKYNYVTSMLDDYECVLSALNALKIQQEETYIEQCKNMEREGMQHNPVPENVVDVLKRIWCEVFPHREIDVKDGKVIARCKRGGQTFEYKGREMSDGERVALYLMAQALCVPSSKTIIIDEPEIHLHPSIMNRLWTCIEKERQDCLFIYITHDTRFAANHSGSKKIWIKEFDGQHWMWEEIKDSMLPEQMLLDILGNRKPVLFVEGTADSYDTKLYSEVFKNYHVVPCGSCSCVISWTKAMRDTIQLHDFDCYGIIDRDYRSEYEIESYKTEGIYTIAVAEVENLLLVPELLEVVNDILGFPDTSRVEQIERYIIEDRFRNEINRQICETVVSEVKYKLSVADISKKNEAEAKQSLDTLFRQISYENIKQHQENRYREIDEAKDYRQVLSVFNRKSLIYSVGHYFGLENKSYCEFVLRQLKTTNAQRIIEAISKYVPTDIPR